MRHAETMESHVLPAELVSFVLRMALVSVQSVKLVALNQNNRPVLITPLLEGVSGETMVEPVQQILELHFYSVSQQLMLRWTSTAIQTLPPLKLPSITWTSTAIHILMRG